MHSFHAFRFAKIIPGGKATLIIIPAIPLVLPHRNSANSDFHPLLQIIHSPTITPLQQLSHPTAVIITLQYHHVLSKMLDWMLDPLLSTTIGEEAQAERLKQCRLSSTSTYRREGEKLMGLGRRKENLAFSYIYQGWAVEILGLSRGYWRGAAFVGMSVWLPLKR